MAISKLELAVETGRWDAGLNKGMKSLQNFINSSGGLTKALSESENKMSKFVQQIGKMESTSTTARGKVRDYSKAFEELAAMYNKLSAAEKNGDFGRQTAASMDSLKSKLAEANKEMEKTSSMIGNLGRSSKGNGTDVVGIGLKSLIGFTGAAGAAYMAFGKLKEGIGHALEITMQFESESANLASILGTNISGVGLLTEQAKELGAATQYTAIEIVQLQTELAKLGFTQREIKDSTTSVQAFATATGADLAGAAALCGAALRAFGLDAREMERVSSAMAVSTTKSALSYEKLSQSLSTVAPVAKAFGFTIEDTLALLGKLSDAGFDASSAATATRNILLNLADSGGKLAKTLGSPVKSLDDMMKAFKELKDKGVDLNATLELTDKRSVAAFNQFLNTADGVLDLRDAVTDCSKAMNDMQDVKLDTLQGSVTLLSSAWDGFILNVNNSQGVLKSAVDWLTMMVNKANEYLTGDSDGMKAAGGSGRVDREVDAVRNASKEDRPQKQREYFVKYNKEIGDLQKNIDRWNKLNGTYSLSALNEIARMEAGGFKIEEAEDKLKALIEFRNKYDAESRKVLFETTEDVDLDSGGDLLIGSQKKSKGRKLKINSLEDAMSLQGMNGFNFGSLNDYNNQLKGLKKLMQEATDPEEYAQYFKRAEEISAKIASKMFSFELEADVDGFKEKVKKEMEDAFKGIKIDPVVFESVATKSDKIKTAASGIAGAFDAASNSLGKFAEESQAAAAAQKTFSIMAAIAQLVAQFAAIPKGVEIWSWIAGTIAGTGTLIATIASLKDVGSYAEGGIVPGNFNGGRDSTYVYASPGEVILNRAQQRNLAGQLTATGQSSVTLKGEDLILAINNTGSRKGLGKIQFAR